MYFGLNDFYLISLYNILNIHIYVSACGPVSVYHFASVKHSLPSAQYVAHGQVSEPEVQAWPQPHPSDFGQSSVALCWNSRATHAKSVDHEMNSHKYNGRQSRHSRQEQGTQSRQTDNLRPIDI